MMCFNLIIRIDILMLDIGLNSLIWRAIKELFDYSKLVFGCRYSAHKSLFKNWFY